MQLVRTLDVANLAALKMVWPSPENSPAVLRFRTFAIVIVKPWYAKPTRVSTSRRFAELEQFVKEEIVDMRVMMMMMNITHYRELYANNQLILKYYLQPSLPNSHRNIDIVGNILNQPTHAQIEKNLYCSINWVHSLLIP